MKRVIYIIGVATLFILFLLSCDDNSINEHIDEDTPECPPIDIVSSPPYNSPVWHPSGKFIGFNYTPLDSITYPYGEHCFGIQHFNYDSTGFWLVDIDGKNKRRILKYQLQLAAWNANGDWIAFVLDAQIYKMPFNIVDEKFDTTRLEQLTFEGRNFFPSWSPDGEWIAFDSNKDSPNGMNFIWKMKSDGTNKIRIAYEPTVGEIREPDWSPDSKYIAHQRYVGVGAPEVAVMDSNGGKLQRLTFDTNFDSFPKYSPDNKTIGYLSQTQGSYTYIHMLNMSTKISKKLTTSRVVSNIFDWSPDGSSIVYTHHDFNDWRYENGTIWVIDVKDVSEYQLTFNVKRR